MRFLLLNRLAFISFFAITAIEFRSRGADLNLTCRQLLYLRPQAEAIRQRFVDSQRSKNLASGSAIEGPPKDVLEDNIDGVALPSRFQITTMARALVQTIETNYGPRLRKQDTIGLDWEALKQKLFSQLSRVKTEKDLLFLLSELLMQFNDGHVSSQIPSSLTWSLPMQLSFSPSEGGYYVVTGIDPRQAESQRVSGVLPTLRSKLVSINGLAAEEFRKQRKYFDSSGNTLTNQILFGRKIVSMTERSGIPLSQFGTPVWDFVFAMPDSDGTYVTRSVSFRYQVSGVGLIGIDTILPPRSHSLIPPIKIPAAAPETSQTLKPLVSFKSVSPQSSVVTEIAQKIENLFGLRSVVDSQIEISASMQPQDRQEVQQENQQEPRQESLSEFQSRPKNQAKDQTHSQRAEGVLFRMGQKLPVFKLPEDFTEIAFPEELSGIFNPEHIFAGVFKHKGKRVGFLRLPTYSVLNVGASPLVIDYFVKQLEMRSDFLIFDQMDNPGGSVTYADFWVQRLVGQLDKKKHIQFKVKPTHNFMRQFAELLKSLDAQTRYLPESIRKPILDEMAEQFEIVHRAFASGDSLSEPITLLPFLRTLNLILSSQKGDRAQLDFFEDVESAKLEFPVYSKPIFMLISPLDFSCGDATPANLQDYGRVKLVGQRTAGAGGTVENFSLRLMSAPFDFSLTTSLMYRPSAARHYIENEGVHPDYVIEPTLNDFLNGYQEYFTKLLKYIDATLNLSAGQ